MSDQTPDPTAWDDDQLDDLLDRLAERAAERDDLDLPGSGPTRRTVLATLLGAGGLGVGATQLGSAASWGSASGTVGTQSTPIDTANVRDLDAKVIETEQISISDGAVRIEQTSDQSIASRSETQIQFDSTAVARGGSVLTADTSNNVVTIDSTGVYAIDSSVKMNLTNDGTKMVGFLNKGKTDVGQATNVLGGTTNLSVGMSALVEVSSVPVDISTSLLHTHGTTRSTVSGVSTVHLDVARVL